MASDTGWRRALDNLTEKLQEQEWFQQLKGKWDELDPMARLYIRLGSVAGVALVVFAVVLASIFQVRALKSDLNSKIELGAEIQSGSDELRILRAKGGPAGGGEAVPWQQAVKTAAATAGLDEAALEFGAEKPGEIKGTATETLVEIKAKRISIRQLVRYAVQLEAGQSPVKLRNLVVEAEDPEGYMNATLALSIFEPKK